MDNSLSQQDDFQSIPGSDAGQESFLTSDAITYNHMEESQAFKYRYLSQSTNLPDVPFWPFVIEELIIAALLLTMLLTS